MRRRLGSGPLLWILIGTQLSAAPAQARPTWVGSWASAQMTVADTDALPASATQDMTLRQLVRMTLGGSRVRLRISNAFGRSPLTISGVHVARAFSANSSRIHPATDRSVTFSGSQTVTVPAGAEYESDPVALAVPALATLAVSVHLADVPKLQTGHPGSRATSYFVRGDQLSAAELRGAATTDRWYFVSGVDIEAVRPSAAIVVLGDSITDGHGVPVNSDERWPDYLANRLQLSAATRSLGVLNVGIGGNRMLEDGLGPNAAARFGRDVLAREGVKYLIILEGVNDLGVLTRDAPASSDMHRALVQRILAAYAQIIARAHDRGVKVIAGTIMPFATSGYYHPPATTEADRAIVNAWLRAPGHADAVIDFDAIMRDPSHPDRLRPELDSGDGLHPSATGYRLMGYSVPLSLFSGSR